jgi:hypothetical protein
VLLSARPGSGGPPYPIEAEYPLEGAGEWTDEAAHEQDRF